MSTQPTKKPDPHRLLDLLHFRDTIFPRCSCGWRSLGAFDNAGLAAGAWSDHRFEARRLYAASSADRMRASRRARGAA